VGSHFGVEAMKALVTLQDGQMFRIDMQSLSLTAMDTLGKPLNTGALQGLPAVVPRAPFTFAFADGIEIKKDKVATVIYFR
jgi:hypothetical protein